jgi:arylsulfatase A-like enzyme
MTENINRREFLKLLAALPLVKLAIDSPGYQINNTVQEGQISNNILVLVFDALSAKNIALYGYPRQTMPNLEQFANKATVYHRHYAGGSFTSPGTASLLTGTYPWTNRAFHLYGTVAKQFVDKNIFSILNRNNYERITFTHNDLASMLLHQFSNELEVLKNTEDLCLFYEYLFADTIFEQDHNAAFLGERTIMRGQRGQGTQLPSSTFFSAFHRVWREKSKNDVEAKYKELFPRGLPSTNAGPFVYLLEDAIDWVEEEITNTAKPFLGYFHFLPPHEPYHTRKEFVRMFRDGWEPISKPDHHFSGGVSETELQVSRRWYDEYIAYVDAEFGRLVNSLEQKGMLKNTNIIFTSDHGEMFERGILEHITPTLFEPIAHVPLVIHHAGQENREDVEIPTSAVDILPTINSMAGNEAIDWSEGTPLPSTSESATESERNIFTMDAKSNPKSAPFKEGTVAMVKDRYKLIYYTGYDGFDNEFEMYDLINDPEEMENLYSESNTLAGDLKVELLDAVEEANKPYS